MEAGHKSGERRSPDQAAVRGLVGEIVVRVCRQKLGASMRSLLLTGSVARDEATMVAHPGGWRVLGDADFIVVLERQAPLPTAGAVATLTAQCESELRADGVVVHVGMAAVHDDYFRRLPAYIFTYELRCCGRVVCGDDNPLELIPAFPASAIDAEDAWRLLANRIIECLELSPSLPERSAATSEELHYRTVKLFLDMATSLLVFLHAYEPTYAGRARKLRQLAEQGGEPAVLPFALKDFAGRVDECTRWKISGGEGVWNSGPEIFREALDYARRLWQWELAKLTATEPGASPEMLFAAAAARQSAWQKIRGWLYVARRSGWLRGLRAWPRWIAMGRRCTPRYFIYEASWRLTGSADEPFGEAEIRRIRELLPVSTPCATKAPAEDLAGDARQQLVRAVVWNYRTFLTETRA
jgi:hypothetical protein